MGGSKQIVDKRNLGKDLGCVSSDAGAPAKQ